MSPKLSDDKAIPTWFAWIWERGFLLWQIVLGVAAAALLGTALLIYFRVQHIDDNLAFTDQPPGGHIETVELPVDIAKGQTVYVPVYSHVYHQQGQPFKLTVTLSIRNTDVDTPIVIKSVDYYDTQGKLVQKYLDRPQRLAPLASMEHLVKEQDLQGGAGAKFLVAWVAEEIAHEPLMQAVMIGTAEGQGLSFVCDGVVVEEEK